MYGHDKKIFRAKNGKKKTFFYRTDTNDWDTIFSAFVKDEYGILDLDLRRGDQVLDIGAHIGAVTLLLTTLNATLEIFSYEPVRDNFILLKKNIEENRPESEVNIFNKAVWFYDEDTVKMYYGINTKDGKKHKFIGSQFMIHKFYDPRVFRRVGADSLNKVFKDNRIKECKFMKLDAEGAEYGILKGASQETLKKIERIHGEYHNIDPDRIDKPRAMLLKQTKGVFRDATGFEEKGPVGPFRFVRNG